MREKIAAILYEVAHKAFSDYGGLYENRTNEILTLIREEIEKVENPYQNLELYKGFKRCRSEILKALEAE